MSRSLTAKDVDPMSSCIQETIDQIGREEILFYFFLLNICYSITLLILVATVNQASFFTPTMDYATKHTEEASIMN